MNTNDQAIRDALTKAWADTGASPESPSQARRTYVTAPPVVKADPRFAAYGEQLLAACRTETPTVDAQGFWSWRRTQPQLQGVGVITQLRLWRNGGTLD